MPSPELSRRTFLKISLGLSGAAGLIGLLKYLGYQPVSSEPIRFTLKAPGEYAVGSATSLAEAKAWLFRDEAGLYAISAICSHLGCTVGFLQDQFECPCHGSRYNAAGYVLRGPATQPLSYLALTLSEDGLVVLDIKKVVTAQQRLAVPA
jgi:cytochrome b6-f complex iron-sulfur subunit